MPKCTKHHETVHETSLKDFKRGMITQEYADRLGEPYELETPVIFLFYVIIGCVCMLVVSDEICTQGVCGCVLDRSG